MKVKEVYKTPRRLNQKKKVSPYYNQNTKHKGRPIRNTPDFQWNT